MESGAGARNEQEESATQAAGYQKRRGSSTAKGEDYEVALCSLIFLRALRLASDFFLASNHHLAGDFDDVVLLYRLKGDQPHQYRAILVQAKHKERTTNKKFKSLNPFNLDNYLNSYKKIRHHWQQHFKVEDIQIKFKEKILVLYTNTDRAFSNNSVDVTNDKEVQHLKEFLDTGGRLRRITEAKKVGLPQGQETEHFLSHLLLCTEQMSVDTANSILEEELRKFFKLTSPEVARELRNELWREMKTWWSKKETAHYLTAECEEWKKVLQMQITRLNRDTIDIDRHLNLEFTNAVVELSDFASPLKLRWIRVRDEFQSNAVRSRLFRTEKNSLVINFKSVVNHYEEVAALWRNNLCPTLVLDMSAEESSPMLESLQKEVQSGAGRRLVVIAKGKPTSDEGWSEVEAEPTWSVLHQVTRDRLLEAPVRLQGEAVALRDVVGTHVSVSDVISGVMSDDVIGSVCLCGTEMELGAAMRAPLEYNVPRCLQRTSSNIINIHSMENRNILVFSSNYFSDRNEFTKRFKTINYYDDNEMAKVEYPTIVREMTNDYNIRRLCNKFRVSGICGEFSTKGFQGNITEYIPFTWTCEEKIVVIEGPPGVGKSSFVTMMCSAVKEKFPEAWVLRLDMGRHTDYIKKTEVIHIKEFVLKGLEKKPTSLEHQLLEHSLTVTENVFLFLDAFDEISPIYTSKCCDLLKGIAQTIRYRQMVVTTRPVTTKDVEEALKTKAFTLPVFSKEEQHIFMKQFSAAKGKPVGEEEISLILQSAGPVLEIPLLCRMAAEVFLHSRKQLFLKYLNPWRRVLLYQVFVKQSVKKRVAEKLGLDTSNPGIKVILKTYKDSHLQDLQGLAVRKLMPVDQLPPLSIYTVTPKEKLGLVVNTGGGVDFEHQTFAEYFLGSWLACHWQDCPQQHLHDVLFRDGFQFVTAKFNWSLFADLPLHLAVAQGDEDLIKKHLSPGTTDRGGRSALHVAAMTKDCPRKVWELLITSGEDLNRKDDVLGATAVQYAEMFSNWAFVDLGLKNEANSDDLNFFTVEETTKKVLIAAVKSDLVCLCQFIWRRNSNIFENLHLLHLAAANNSNDAVKFLIEIGYELDDISERRYTPLQEAARHGHLEVVKFLLQKGADINIKTEDGETALSEAAWGGHSEIVKFLLEKEADINIKTEDGDTALTKAADRGNLEVVKFLLEKGADINIETKYGVTALTNAADRGNLEVVKFLLEKEADINIKTEYGETALTYAAWGGHSEIVKFLLEKGADINIETENGHTALTKAAAICNLEIVKILLEKGADINIETKSGHTAFTMAADRGHLEVVNFLLEKGVDINIKTKGGVTALTRAGAEGHMEVVKFLLEKGAAINIETENGDTALTQAARYGHLEVVKFLQEKGADINLKNHRGEMAMMLADKGGHREVLEFLRGMEDLERNCDTLNVASSEPRV